MFHVKQSQCCTFYTASFAATATRYNVYVRLLDFYAQLQRPEIENRSKMISLNVIQYNSLMTPTMWHFVLGNAWSQHYLLRSGSKIMRRRQREPLQHGETSYKCDEISCYCSSQSTNWRTCFHASAQRATYDRASLQDVNNMIAYELRTARARLLFTNYPSRTWDHRSTLLCGYPFVPPKLGSAAVYHRSARYRAHIWTGNVTNAQSWAEASVRKSQLWVCVGNRDFIVAWKL